MLHTKVARYSTVKFSYVKNIVHLPWIVQWFCETPKKQGSSVIFGHILLQGTTTGMGVPIMQHSLIWNLIHMDFQWDQIHLQAELLVLNLPHGPG